MKKNILRILSVLLIVVLLAVLIPAGLIVSGMNGEGEPGGEVLIVLGTTVNGTEPSPMLRQRLDAALNYLNTYPDAVCIVTGGKGDEVNLSEAQCMYNYLTAAGIAAERITMEDRATSTVENLRNVRAMLNTDEVDILSSDFHLYRAGLIAEDAGFVPTLIPAKTEPLSLLSPGSCGKSLSSVLSSSPDSQKCRLRAAFTFSANRATICPSRQKGVTMKRIHPKWFLCGMLAAVGLFLIFCLRGYKFGGLFLLGLSALIPVYDLLKHEFLRRVLTAMLALGFVVLSITGGVIARSAQGTEAAEADYLIVLGCQVNGTVPSRMLRQRIDAAADYLIAHPHSIAIVSGGMGSGESITEAECMYNYLTAQGIAPERIILEDKATSTMENLRFSLALMDEGATAAIVSNEFHLYRAGQMAASLGLDAALIPADTEYPILTASYTLREILAVWKYHLPGG